ncbi:bck1-like resistance to osmotic shock, partial [Sarracenia purpurea var. burkii]
KIILVDFNQHSNLFNNFINLVVLTSSTSNPLFNSISTSTRPTRSSKSPTMAASASSASSGAANFMLSVSEKKTVSVDLYRPLRSYIVSNYSEREAQNLEDDLQTLKRLRADAERATADSLPARRDLLQNYYRSLCAVESRFPISGDKDHVNAVTFTWHDAFKNKQKASQQNIHLEKAAVLFNLGAVHSQIGLTFDRSSIEGRRQASHAFIAAAGAFAFLRDNESAKASMGSSATVDVSVECAGMLERLMLAQAQECVFENTIAKGSTPGVCAKISRQVSVSYFMGSFPGSRNFSQGIRTKFKFYKLF